MTHTPPPALDRREAIRRVALLLGGAVSAPAVAGVLAGCDAAPPPPGGGAGAAAPGAWRALRGEEGELVATVAEHIIPATDTPGARAAEVHRFVDTMLAEYYPARETARFREGLAALDARARREHGAPFLRCAPAQQRALLERIDEEAFGGAPRHPAGAPNQGAPNQGAPNPDAATQRGEATAAQPRPGDVAPRAARAPAEGAAETTPFFRTMKELTLLGYYTSQLGATRELRHSQTPGRFDGCVPLAPGDRAWAV